MELVVQYEKREYEFEGKKGLSDKLFVVVDGIKIDLKPEDKTAKKLILKYLGINVE